MKNISANWKTTLTGAITGGTISLDAVIKDGLTNGWPQALIGLAIILIGVFAKDGDTTGVGATATKVEGAIAPYVPIVDQATANSASLPIQDVHTIMDKLLALVPAPAATAPPVAVTLTDPPPAQPPAAVDIPAPPHSVSFDEALAADQSPIV